MHRGTPIGGAVVLAVLGIGAILVDRAGGSGTPARPRGAVGSQAGLSAHLANADAAAGATLFAQCAACHSVGRDAVDLDGPNLYGVVGSPVAERRTRYAYSAALRRAGGVWTFARLDTWLTKPGAFAPGTNMSFAGLSDPQDRADLIAFLNTQGSGLALPQAASPAGAASASQPPGTPDRDHAAGDSLPR